jgi:hypothetical protein
MAMVLSSFLGPKDIKAANEAFTRCFGRLWGLGVPLFGAMPFFSYEGFFDLEGHLSSEAKRWGFGLYLFNFNSL